MKNLIRCWNGEKMIYPEIVNVRTGEIHLGFRELENGISEDVIVMFNSHVKDDNGLDIFEGDILEGQGVVSYKQESGCWVTTKGGFICLSIFTRRVLGNKYENPELLNR